MIIIVRFNDWEIRRVLVDQGSFVDILYLDVFERLHHYLDDLKAFKGSLVGFFGASTSERLHKLKITFGVREQDKNFMVRYLVIDYSYSYNMIIG